MPTRLIHQELLTSPSLLECSPRAQDGFHRLILVADDFGCLETEAVVVKGVGWAKRSDVSVEDVARWLAEWSRARMLFLWMQRGRYFGYLTGWHGERGQRWRVEYMPVEGEKRGRAKRDRGSKRKTPPPPGWTGQRPVPWTAPTSWAPGEVWTGAAESAWPSPAVHDLGLFVPARERSGDVPAIAVAVQDAVAVQVAIPPSLRSGGGAESNPIAGANGAAAAKVARCTGVAALAGSEPHQVEAGSAFARWLAETYPDIRDPVGFERAQAAANPGVDLLVEARKAWAWETANPAQKKHNHGRYLHRWFRRAQDDAARGPIAAARNGTQGKATVPAARFSETRSRGFT